MAESAYDLLKKSYEKQQAAINAQQQQQTQEKADREALAKKTLEANNRGVYTTYKNAINPYGTVASQTNRPTGTSEYMKNAAYGTMLHGLGQNQANYSADMQNSNSLWTAYLAEKAGQEADLEANYANSLIEQQRYDAEQARINSSYGGGSGGGLGSINDGEDPDAEGTLYGKIADGNKWSATNDYKNPKNDTTIDPSRTVTKGGTTYYYNKYGVLVKTAKSARYSGTESYIDENGQPMKLK